MNCSTKYRQALLPYILFFIFFSLVGLSCSKSYLDIPPTTEVVQDLYVSDLKSCESLMNGVYVMLSDYVYHGLNTVYGEIIADNLQPATGSSIFINQYSWNQLSTEDNIFRPSSNDKNENSLWTSGYGVIRQCSFLIENVDRFRSQNLADADRIKGEAYAVRALVHHLLVNTFAQPFKFTSNASHQGIPYITTSDYTQRFYRKTVNEVYEGVINDLKTAINLLPSDATNRYHISEVAAKAILARVLFYKHDFQSAAGIATEVTRQVPIMADGDYPLKLFTQDDYEAIFYLPPAEANYTSTFYTTQFASTFFRSTPAPVFYATTDVAFLIKEWPTDKRGAWVDQANGNWTITKFPMSAFPGISDPNGAYCQPVIRSSELYLIAAESYAQLANYDSARDWLNSIRLRANIPPVSPSISGSSLLDSIFNERRRELAFEGFRMFDLLRMGRGVSRASALDPILRELPYSAPRAIAPIPLNDITIGGLSQNPSYY